MPKLIDIRRPVSSRSSPSRSSGPTPVEPSSGAEPGERLAVGRKPRHAGAEAQRDVDAALVVIGLLEDQAGAVGEADDGRVQVGDPLARHFAPGRARAAADRPCSPAAPPGARPAPRPRRRRAPARGPVTGAGDSMASRGPVPENMSFSAACTASGVIAGASSSNKASWTSAVEMTLLPSSADDEPLRPAAASAGSDRPARRPGRRSGYSPSRGRSRPRSAAP